MFLDDLHKLNICCISRDCIKQQSILNPREISVFCGDAFTTRCAVSASCRSVVNVSLSCLQCARSDLTQTVQTYHKRIVSPSYPTYHSVWGLPYYYVTFCCLLMNRLSDNAVLKKLLSHYRVRADSLWSLRKIDTRPPR